MESYHWNNANSKLNFTRNYCNKIILQRGKEQPNFMVENGIKFLRLGGKM